VLPGRDCFFDLNLEELLSRQDVAKLEGVFLFLMASLGAIISAIEVETSRSISLNGR